MYARLRLERRRAGITVIELIIAISIIAVLMSLLLPAITSARAASRRTQCQNIAVAISAAQIKHAVVKHAWTVCAHLLTLGVALLGFVFFRTPTFAEAVSYLGRLLHWQHDGTRLDSPYIAAAVGAVLLTHLLIRKDEE